MPFRFEEIEERLPDLRGRHHLKRIENLAKIYARASRKSDEVQTARPVTGI
jgi:hypothetical protein